jgi:hypothetical protein
MLSEKLGLLSQKFFFRGFQHLRRNFRPMFKPEFWLLLAVGKLTPLGDPAPNAPKWFAAVEMIRLAVDQDWLHKATKEISKYWRQKRERRQSFLTA